MKKNRGEKTIKVLGIDMGKKLFHLHGVDEHGKVVHAKQLTRNKMMLFMARLEPCLVGLEACGGAHHLIRRLREFGHDVRMMAPQFVKPYVKSNKIDFLDAEAICEAVSRPNMRFVPRKSVEQQDLQSQHRVRSLAMGQRTALINQIRGLLQEYGVIIPRGASQVRKRVPEILEDDTNELTSEMRELVNHLKDELVHLDGRIARYDRKFKTLLKANRSCQILSTLDGIGPLGATALVAAVGDIKAFNNSREMSAWLGVVPRQHSTGGKTKLLGISKRGNTYLRTILIHGARAALRVAMMKKKMDRRSRWMVELADRRGFNVAAVALANKNIRTAWAMLSNMEEYQPGYVV